MARRSLYRKLSATARRRRYSRSQARTYIGRAMAELRREGKTS